MKRTHALRLLGSIGLLSLLGMSCDVVRAAPAPPAVTWQVSTAGPGQSASFSVTFSSTQAGAGTVLFGSGPNCAGLTGLATNDLGNGTTQHTVKVTGNDLAGTVGNIGIVPGATYWYETVTRTAGGTEVDNNGGKCYRVTVPARRYRVTITDTTYAQGFSFPVAATHSPSAHMFQIGSPASNAVAAVAQNGNPVPLFQALQGAAGVTDVVVNPFPVASAGNPTAFWKQGLPYFNGKTLTATTGDNTLSNTVSFDISAQPGDVFSLLGMLMCTNDGLAGVDSVALPANVGQNAAYTLGSYDAGVEANTFYTPDIVDPCALMAPYSNGAPALPVTDGNRNSPPTPSQGASTSLVSTEPDLGVSLAQNDPISALSGTIPAPSDTAHAGSFVPSSWGWAGPVGTVSITRIG